MRPWELLPSSVRNFRHNQDVQPTENTQWVVERAGALGFDLCGVAAVEDFAELEHLPEWLARGYAGEMRYLHDPRRASPAAALAGARSLIVCAMNYNTPHPYLTEASAGLPALSGQVPVATEDGGLRGWISRYAWGGDYHEVLGERLETLIDEMRGHFAEPFEARAYVDTGPILERVVAKYAGLGWLGKNTCLINEQLGSWLFLGVIITTLELEPSLAPDEHPSPDLCGQCTLCLDACPTTAIVEPYLLDARRCISYLTIELRGPILEEFHAAMGRHVFGCDICQDVCPWNRRAPTSTLEAFQPRDIETRDAKTENDLAPHSPLGTRHSLLAPALEWLVSLTEDEFREIFRGSPIKRTKWRGLIRNACIALGNVCGSELQPAISEEHRARLRALLERLAASPDPVVCDAAQWAARKVQRHAR